MPVQKLERETTVSITQLDSLLHDFLSGPAGEDDPDAEGVEKANKQRRVIIY